MIFEKVNPAHPDKVADRIAGAIVDLAYSKQESPKIAVEVSMVKILPRQM
jgi:S-adenosylmethionine synthetase